MLDRYGFDMEFIEKQATSMHGSSEGHTAYLYRCTHAKKAPLSKAQKAPPVDPLFRECFEVLEAGPSKVLEWVDAKHQEDERMSGRTARPLTRSQKAQQNAV
mmetsp:Transcript_58766/g.133037  ORF Transcript_58766/g.133037 Transcript_58766/m.133037 type:complete len:102 (+) Transcript_58766:725-1030(+)